MTPADTPHARQRMARAQVELLSLAQGFLTSSVLFALLRLDAFEQVGAEGRRADELAEALGLETAPLTRILNAGVALGLLEADAGLFHVPLAYRPLLLHGSESGYLGDWLRFMESWYLPFASLEDAARTGGRAQSWAISDETARRNTLAMHDFASSRGTELLQFLDLAGCTSLLDVGCGPGTYAFEIGRRHPGIRLFLMDQPVVLKTAKEIQARYRLSNELTYLPRDLATEDITGAYDLVLISNTLQAFDDDRARELLRQIHRVLTPGGSVVVQAQFLNEDLQSPRWPVFVDLGCLRFTAGRNHSSELIETWLAEAGFSRIERHRMSVINANAFVRAWR